MGVAEHASSVESDDDGVQLLEPGDALLDDRAKAPIVDTGHGRPDLGE